MSSYLQRCDTKMLLTEELDIDCQQDAKRVVLSLHRVQVSLQVVMLMVALVLM